jgi:hypothetical protein
MQRVGLQTRDVVGGLTIRDAANQIGCTSILYNDARHGKLPVIKIGRHKVIPHDAFEAWKAARRTPPAGFVRLASLRAILGFHGDKLAEFAKQGRVPTAIKCQPIGTREHNAADGVWYIEGKLAKKLVADRRAGRRMPWMGMPDPHNLKVTFRLWTTRQHPKACATCRDIWGPTGAPKTFAEYSARYPPLLHGAKKHLTRVWLPGLRLSELSREVHISAATIAYAIRTGALRGRRWKRCIYVSRLDATRWKARKCPTGASDRSWMSLRFVAKQYGFTRAELEGHITAGRLKLKVGDKGPQRDIRYVLKQQVRELRDELGFTEAAAARRVGVSIARLRVLLRGTEWRPAPRIPFDVVTTCIKRQESAEGETIPEVARILGKTTAWVEREIAAGTVRVLRNRWNAHRRYITFDQFKKLCDVALHPPDRFRWSKDWLLSSDAALLAAVSSTQIVRWSDEGDIKTRTRGSFRRYHRRSVMVRARRYWTSEVRFKRAVPPAWLQAEQKRDSAA